MNKPFSQACENNKEPILLKLAPLLDNATTVLEIGSGTGQHAVHFAARLPQLRWQCSDRPENLPGIMLWLAEAGLPNLPAPLQLDVAGDWPAGRFDAIYSANTCHIMSWDMVRSLFRGVGHHLNDGGLLVIYGPFNYGGAFTSESNAHFDAHLRHVNPQQGIRDVEAVNELAQQAGLRLNEDYAMPANNRLLAWRKM